ncbi:5-formyltetrahydrofolate cyclo-ligase [Mediterraneibacter glycyrrhizinilyticus]|nr:5-formyltetrahydrofolate cyclo-ligase [Mediterraneibacter glycyrrhizinilyticus]
MKSTEIKQTKKEIREQYRRIREALPPEKRKSADEMIAKRLFDCAFYQNARFIYCYASLKDEAGTNMIIEEALRNGKRVALPRVRGKRRMEFCFIKSPADLKPGFMGIKEPGPWCPKAPAPFKDSVVVMPGIAFDRNGTRAGYGGGYYDTYLEGHAECIKAALAYSVQIAPEIPAAPTDIKVDMIVTEEELIICSQDFREIR